MCERVTSIYESTAWHTESMCCDRNLSSTQTFMRSWESHLEITGLCLPVTTEFLVVLHKHYYFIILYIMQCSKSLDESCLLELFLRVLHLLTLTHFIRYFNVKFYICLGRTHKDNCGQPSIKAYPLFCFLQLDRDACHTLESLQLWLIKLNKCTGFPCCRGSFGSQNVLSRPINGRTPSTPIHSLSLALA